MKALMATTAAAAMLAFSAHAQVPTEASPPVADTPTETPDAEAEGGLIVRGVEPSEALGAIDTEELVGDEQDSEAKPEDDALAEADVSAEAETDIQTASLPDEVQSAISDGEYTTEDLVAAQLAAIETGEPLDSESN